MNILVMGGTQFNGLALVHELARAGHCVTILNRGKTEAQLPSGIERLICDRTDHAGLKATLTGLEWDCVYDISAYRPEDEHTIRFDDLDIAVDWPVSDPVLSDKDRAAPRLCDAPVLPVFQT